MTLILGERPNLKPARNREKALNLIKLCDEIVQYGERPISAKELTQKLGNQTKPLGKWLRLGLTKYGSYSVANGKSYSYRVNRPFVEALRQELTVAKPTPVQVATQAQKLFTPAPRGIWHRKGHRYYAWWTNMKKAKRIELFTDQFGTMYEYDICVARPTILLQLYDRMVNPTIFKLSDAAKLPAWRELVQDRRKFRQTMCHELSLEYETVKWILQSVTNGGYVSTGCGNPVARELGPITAHLIMQHPLYLQLRKDFLYLRDVMCPGLPKRQIPGKLYTAYETIEDGIMTLIDRELKTRGLNVWYVHDCFFSDQPIETASLEALVKTKLGFEIRLEEERYTASSRPAV